ncbi:hypothetical protein QTH97_07960 [Variovorax sp. J22R24]|uniref:hypothetical protein n=1 Tax=Variovorax gracilis TaxID=3053502 RepID=UPI002575D5EA|nr:hypothetical protein [Variovorax sp. J22R24]MDM0104864.1 hypothetical protein [Variovorax sp. J22R24]
MVKTLLVRLRDAEGSKHQRFQMLEVVFRPTFSKNRPDPSELKSLAPAMRALIEELAGIRIDAVGEPTTPQSDEGSV